ncbi:MAG: DUF3365 domain-containing protein [Ideonella sp.]|nr:DUF3365 domain-containing protein [Ideonella sp.]MCC7455822.1 DUF3365 domain-containing protein [Nitrospira sp.]
MDKSNPSRVNPLPSRLGLRLVVPMLLFAGGLGAASWTLSQSLLLEQTISEGRTVADMVENIGRWASQYGGVHARTVGSSAKMPGNFLTRSVYAMSSGDGQVLSGSRVGDATAERNALDRMEAYHWKNPALVQREVADVVAAAGSKARYRLTARTVLNRNNTPDAFEREALDAVQTAADQGGGRAAQEYWRVSGGRLLYARSVVAQASCLRCHGSAESAPEFIRTNAQFNGGGGYGYVEGKPSGLISVALPLPHASSAFAKLPPAVWAAVAAAGIGALWLLGLALHRPAAPTPASDARR